MKTMNVLFFVVFLSPLYCFSQNIILPNINLPGEISIGIINGVILGENLMGPRKVIFSGNQMVFQKQKILEKSLGFDVGISYVDKLNTIYSGRIYSPGINEPFVFINKTAEELVLMEVMVFPIRLEQPYTLFMDLKVQTSTKHISANQSDDAGIYIAKVYVNLIKI